MAPVLALNFSDSFMDVGKYVRHKIDTPLTQSIIVMCSCIYFVGSASSFYFVWDFCLYGNMSTEIAYTSSDTCHCLWGL